MIRTMLIWISLARPSTGKWVQGKELVLPNKEDCYVYLRPNSSVYQYFLSIDGEGVERKSTGKKDLEQAKEFALNRIGGHGNSHKVW